MLLVLPLVYHQVDGLSASNVCRSYLHVFFFLVRFNRYYFSVPPLILRPLIWFTFLSSSSSLIIDNDNHKFTFFFLLPPPCFSTTLFFHHHVVLFFFFCCGGAKLLPTSMSRPRRMERQRKADPAVTRPHGTIGL